MAEGKCFVPECGNDAIGQCTGRRGAPCGHAFCAKHSLLALCDECAALQESGKLYASYLDAAVNVSRFGRYSGLFAVFLIPVVFSSKYLYGLFHSWVAYAAFAAVLLVIACGAGWLVFKMRFLNACKTHRRFDEFYKAHKAGKAGVEEMMDIASDITAETVVAVTGGLRTDDESARRDVNRIRNRLYRKNPPAP